MQATLIVNLIGALLMAPLIVLLIKGRKKPYIRVIYTTGSKKLVYHLSQETKPSQLMELTGRLQDKYSDLHLLTIEYK